MPKASSWKRALGGDVPVLRKPFTLDQLAAAVEENLPR